MPAGASQSPVPCIVSVPSVFRLDSKPEHEEDKRGRARLPRGPCWGHDSAMHGRLTRQLPEALNDLPTSVGES